VYRITPAMQGLFTEFYIAAPDPDTVTHVLDIAPEPPPPGTPPPPTSPITAEVLRVEFTAADLTTLNAAKAYANSVAGGGIPFVHQQSAPAASWPITHGLGKFPSVVLVLDSDPTEAVYTDVQYTDENNLTVVWPSPESGKAYLN
jgi:hypothetical protein